MDQRVRTLDDEASTLPERTEIREYPLPVADEWDELVARSNTLADVIDTHLNFEEKLQGIKMRPVVLCPEQRESLASDLAEVSR